jgi:hypothetical protein
MTLFMASTKIAIGDGETASFWHDNWCIRGPLATWAPDLYSIASRKNRSVARINSPIQLTQYIEIWDIVHTTILDPLRSDSTS